MNKELQQHWDRAYNKTETEKLGWFEANPKKTLELIKESGISKEARILNVGVGTTTLIDKLLEEGYSNLIASDLSEEALIQLEKRIGTNNNVQYIVDDLTDPENLQNIEPVDLWIDRAVLHFFNDLEDQKTYWNLLNKVVKPGGFALIAAFNLDGAEKCCGLPVHRYSKDSLSNGIGSNFNLKDAFDFTFINPGGGERPYVYTLFQRRSRQ